MAYVTKYRVYFSDIENVEYRVLLNYDGYTGGITEYKGATDTIFIQYENSDNKFNPINGSGCTFNFYNDGTLDTDDLFVTGIYDIQIEVHKNIIDGSGNPTGIWNTVFIGFVNPEVMTEDYTWDRGLISITANDGLSALGRDKYFSGSDLDTDGTVLKAWDLGIEKITDVILECFSNLDISRIRTVIDTTGTVSDFTALKVDLANYVDEDEKSLNKREVLESILEPLTLRLYLIGKTCWIIDPTLFAVSGTVAYKAYSNTFTPTSAYDGVYDKDFDISNDDVRFINNDQSVSLVGGFKTMISNYSAYPYPNKVIPSPTADVEVTSVWTFFNYTGGRVGGYGYRQYNTDDYSKYGLTFPSSNGYMSEYAECNTSASDWNTLKGQLNTGLANGEKCFVIKNSISTASTPAAGVEVARITGGLLPKTTDSFRVRFKIMVNFTYDTPSDTPIDTISIKSQIRTGIQIASITNNEVTWDSPTTDQFFVGSSSNLKSQWIDIDFIVKEFDHAENMQIRFYNKVYLAKRDGTVIDISGQGDIFLKDFEVIAINGLDINEDDLEYKTESGVDYLNDFSIDINNSSRRVSGMLDRGAFWNANGEHETYFTRASFPQSGSIGLTMAKAYLGNYEVPYKKISATIATDNLILKSNNTDATDDGLDNIFTPLSIIQDTDNLGTKRFIFSGGTVDLINKTISGSWDELMDANYTITELT